MIRHLFVCLLMLLTTLTAVAQGTISGSVTEPESGEKLPFVNVRVYRAGQQTLLRGSVTDTDGKFSVGKLSYGTYRVQFTYVGYSTLTREVTLSKSQPHADLGQITMSSGSRKLDEASVTGQRAAIRLEVDRKSYDVSQDLSNAGASASEALENIPAVEVDQDGNISLRGSSSVEVWINGKASGLNSDNRGTILEQIPAESIDRIEVIDNPGSKYSAEGSAGIINIVLKRDRKAGYYGSVQAGADTYGGANASVNINYNSKWIDAFANVGYRHRKDDSGSITRQDFLSGGTLTHYQHGDNVTDQTGNNLFTRAGITVHASPLDDINLSGSFMRGGHNNTSTSPYHYGVYTLGSDGLYAPLETSVMTRITRAKSSMMMYNAELDYRHNFTDPTSGENLHYINFSVNHGNWGSDNENVYRDHTVYADGRPDLLSYQSRPQDINSNWTAVKLDYENHFSSNYSLQAGYNADFHHENTPQEAYTDPVTYDGSTLVPDKAYYNRFRYNSQVHALYANATMKFGKFGVQAGLRGEYWKIHTLSNNYAQEYDGAAGPTPYDRDFFQLFPSLFLSYQLTEGDQIQLNYTRRLRRPWGGQLNSFMDTRDANSVSFGNPELTPEYSNSFSLNYLKTFAQVHSFLLSAYYRPTTDVMQRISYSLPTDNRIFTTHMNLSRNTSTGMELTLKDKFWNCLDLTTTASAYYYHLNAFDYSVPDPLYGKTIKVSGASQSRFTWNARIKASVQLPLDFNVQVTGEYRSRQTLTQGVRSPAYGIDLGVKKSFFNRRLTLSMNCRDVLDSRKFIANTHTDSFQQYSKRWRHARKFNFTITWTFGNNKPKKQRPDADMNGAGGEDEYNGGYE